MYPFDHHVQQWVNVREYLKVTFPAKTRSYHFRLFQENNDFHCIKMKYSSFPKDFRRLNSIYGERNISKIQFFIELLSCGRKFRFLRSLVHPTSTQNAKIKNSFSTSTKRGGCRSSSFQLLFNPKSPYCTKIPIQFVD